MPKIDLTTEELVSLSAAARKLPPGPSGRPVHPSTLARWAKHGLRGVRLEVLRAGGRTVTSAAALQRFFTALTDEKYGTPNVSPVPSPNDVEIAQRLDQADW